MQEPPAERVFVITGPRRRARLRLQGSFFVVGRAEPFPVFQDDPLLSREHLAVVALPDGVRVRDLGSRNGVLLNGERLERYAEVTLAPGDVLLAGQTELRLLPDDEREGPDAAAPLHHDEHAVDAEGKSRALRLGPLAPAPTSDGSPAPSEPPGSEGEDPSPEAPLATPGEPVDPDVDELPGDATSELDVPALPAPPAADDPPTLSDLPTAVAAQPPDDDAPAPEAPPLVE